MRQVGFWVIAAQSAVGGEVMTSPDPARWGEVLLNLMAYEPVVDGEVLPDVPIRAIAAGSAAGVPVLVGANRDEQRLFLGRAARRPGRSTARGPAAR